MFHEALILGREEWGLTESSSKGWAPKSRQNRLSKGWMRQTRLLPRQCTPEKLLRRERESIGTNHRRARRRCRVRRLEVRMRILPGAPEDPDGLGTLRTTSTRRNHSIAGPPGRIESAFPQMLSCPRQPDQGGPDLEHLNPLLQRVGTGQARSSRFAVRVRTSSKASLASCQRSFSNKGLRDSEPGDRIITCLRG